MRSLYAELDVDKDGKQSFKEYLRALVVPHLDHAPIAGHDGMPSRGRSLSLSAHFH